MGRAPGEQFKATFENIFEKDIEGIERGAKMWAEKQTKPRPRSDRPELALIAPSEPMTAETRAASDAAKATSRPSFMRAE